MLLKTAFVALSLAVLPALAHASCAAHAQQSQSCAPGTVWDSQSQSCVPQANS